MRADWQKASIYACVCLCVLYLCLCIFVAAAKNNTQNQLKRRFKTCVCQNWFASPICPVLSSHPARTILVTESHAKNTKKKTLNDDGALQLTNRQWDSGTVSRTDRQHTLGQLHTPRQGVSSRSLAAVPVLAPAWGLYYDCHQYLYVHAELGALF